MKFYWKSSSYTALALCVVGTIVSFLFIGSLLNPGYISGYWAGVTAQSGLALVASSGVAALGGAIEGARLRPLNLSTKRSARGSIAIAARSLGLYLLAAIVIQTISFISISVFALKATDDPNWILLLAFLSINIFHLMLGFNLGLRFPIVISAPLALTTSYVWLGSAWSIGYFPLRYMAGLILMDCCRIYESLDMRAIFATIAFNTVGSVGLALFARNKLSPSGIPKGLFTSLAFISAIVAFAMAAQLTSQLGPTPVTNRDSKFLDCRGANGQHYKYSKINSNMNASLPAPIICLYPSQDSKGTFASSLRRVWTHLKDWHLVPPRVIVGNNQPPGGDPLGVVATTISAPGQVAYSFIADFVGPPTSCNESMDAWELRDANYRYLITFLLNANSTAKMDLTQFGPMLNHAELTAFHYLKHQSLTLRTGKSPTYSVSKWLKRSINAVRTCAPVPEV